MQISNYSMSEAVERMVDECGRPVKAIAADIGKPYGTLKRELDLDDDGAKVGIDTLPLLIRACHGDAPKTPPMPLLVLAQRSGFRLVPESANPDKDDLRDECLDDCRELAEFHAMVREGRAHPNVVNQEAVRLTAEIMETAERYKRDREREERI